jgi:hypothetical protein
MDTQNLQVPKIDGMKQNYHKTVMLIERIGLHEYTENKED